MFTHNREDKGIVIEHQILEEGVTWKGTNTPRPVLVVRVHKPGEQFGGFRCAEVSWPSTSDNRPELAAEVAIALTRAATEAQVLDATASQ